MSGLEAGRIIAISISAIAMILNLFVLYLLIRRSERSVSTMLWGSFLTFIALWCFAEIFIRSTDDFFYAISWFSLVLFAGGFVPPILLHFALEFPRRHRILRSVRNRVLFLALVYGPNIVLLVRALMVLGSGEEVGLSNSLWGQMFVRDSLIQTVAADVFLPHYLFLAAQIISAIIVVNRKMVTAKSRIEKKQLYLIQIALSAVFIPGISFDLLLSVTIGLHLEMFSLLVTMVAIITAVAIIKYQFLVIQPETENITFDTKESIDIEPGYAYIFPEGAREKGRMSLLKALSQKREGIVLSNREPEKVKREFKIKKTPVVFIGEATGYEFIIKPNNMDGLVSTMSTFMGVSHSPLMVIDSEPIEIIESLKKQRAAIKDRSRTRKHFLEDWFGGKSLLGLVAESRKALTEGISIIVFSYEEGNKIVKTQRPLQHMSIINFFLMRTLLTTMAKVIRKEGDDPSSILKELGSIDKFFSDCELLGEEVHCNQKYLLKMDRANTINKLRTLNLVLYRSPIKGTEEASEEVIKTLGQVGYTEEELSMPEGAVHFVVTEEHSQAYDLAQELIAAGFDGLCLSTRPPEKVQQLYGLRDVEHRWITTSKTRDEKTIPPSLEHITRDIRAYMNEHDESVVLLDGIELLVSRLGFENVQRFLHLIKDEMATTQARLLIPVNPKAMDKQKLTLLRREVEV